MSGDELGHLEHRDFLLATEDRKQLVISDDIALILWVLEIVLLDVDPDLFDDLGAGHRALADDRLEFCGKFHWLRESRIECSRHSVS